MSKAQAKVAAGRVLETHLRIVEEKKPRLAPGFIVGPTSEQKIRMAADRLDEGGIQELVRLVDAQIPPLVLEPLPRSISKRRLPWLEPTWRWADVPRSSLKRRSKRCAASMRCAPG